MWKVKLDDGVWLADGAVTTTEEDAQLFPDMPSVQAHLDRARRFTAYPNAVDIAGFETEPTSN